MNFGTHAERCALELTKALEATSGAKRRKHYDRAVRHAGRAKDLARSPAAVKIANDMVAFVEQLDASPGFWWVGLRPPREG